MEPEEEGETQAYPTPLSPHIAVPAAPVAPAAVPAPVPAPAAAPSIALDDYTVKDHDTLDTIAVHVQTTPEALLKLNGIAGGIHVGQVIKVPKQGAAQKDKLEISDAGNVASSAACIPRWKSTAE